MSKTNYSRNKILDFRYGNQAAAQPATWYMGLFTSAPSVAGGGTEVSASGYGRIAVTNNNTNFPNAVAGLKANGVAVVFGAAGASWGTVTYFGWFDAVTAGNLHDFAPLSTPKLVLTGDVPEFAIGQLTWQET